MSNLTVYAGRFDNPFFTATDLVYYRDLAFDGFATQANYEVRPGITPFVVAGAFPIFNTNIDAGSTFDFTNQNALPGKAPSNDKWMFGGQLGSNIHLVPEVDFTFAGCVLRFHRRAGSTFESLLHSPAPTDFCSTDLNRPSFAQKGNTYMALRNIVHQPDRSNRQIPCPNISISASPPRFATWR